MTNKKNASPESIPVKVYTPDPSPSPKPVKKGPIYVRKTSGLITQFRRFFGFVFLALFALIPWIPYNGNQAVLLDVVSQRFAIFGLTLWPQDLTLLAYVLIVAAFALFFVTTFAGRVWCGFMCPQTTWTFLFIWFEEKIEGSRNKRIQLDKRKLDVDKVLRKTLKHACWIAVSLVTALTFVGYFTPVADLFIDFFTFNTGFWISFWVLFFAACTYANAGWMREIMCTHICPYARFQSVMFDKDTYIVAYDPIRGEKRGPRSRKISHDQLANKDLGDCVDCKLCVQVCPTGIDIRDGLQYECINCGACVDACNGVMDNMRYPKGLISFTSETQLKGQKIKLFRPKLLGYLSVLLIMVGALVADIVYRKPLEVDIIRDRNTLYRETGDGLVENVYTLKIMNKSQQTFTYNIDVEGLRDYTLIGSNKVIVKDGEVLNVPISIATNPYNISERVTEIFIRVSVDDENYSLSIAEPTRFLYK
jgi:cytochrome c oxidase accessory protein FixG